jgi:hypothetical protein
LPQNKTASIPKHPTLLENAQKRFVKNVCVSCSLETESEGMGILTPLPVSSMLRQNDLNSFWNRGQNKRFLGQKLN